MSATEMLGATVENGLKRIRDRAAALKSVDIQVTNDANDLRAASSIYSTVVQNAKDSGTKEGDRIATIVPNEIIAVSGGPADTTVTSSYEYVEINGQGLHVPKDVVGGEIKAVRHKFPLFNNGGQVVERVTIVELNLGRGYTWIGAFDGNGHLISEDYQHVEAGIRAATAEEAAEMTKWQKLYELDRKAERGEIRDGMPEWRLYQQLAKQYVIEHTVAKADPNNPFDRFVKTLLEVGLLVGPPVQDALSSVAIASAGRVRYNPEPLTVTIPSKANYLKLPPRSTARVQGGTPTPTKFVVPPPAVSIKTTVTYDAKNRIETAEATIKVENLYGGTNTTASARRWAGSFGNYDAGHIFGKLLGGRGGRNSENIFPQLPPTNRGAYAQHEQKVADAVADGKNVYAKVELLYRGASSVPYLVRYTTTIDGVTITKDFGN